MSLGQLRPRFESGRSWALGGDRGSRPVEFGACNACEAFWMAPNDSEALSAPIEPPTESARCALSVVKSWSKPWRLEEMASQSSCLRAAYYAT